MNTHLTLTDQDIIAGIKQKNKEIEAFFYRTHKDKCIQFALKKFFWKQPDGMTIQCDIEDAEEIYNDACVLFVHNVLKDRITQLDAKLSTYLITTMRYNWMNKARSTKRTTPAQEEGSSETDSTNESMRINVRKAIHRLDPKCRAMMTYRYILGWEDYDDIAKATGKGNGDVIRNLLSRCRKRFREHYVQTINFSGI